METSKRRQIPTTNACPNFSFANSRTSIFVVISLRFFVTHLRHFYKFPHSQRKPTACHTVRALAHTQASLLWLRAGRAQGPARASPGIMSDKGNHVQNLVTVGLLGSSFQCSPNNFFILFEQFYRRDRWTNFNTQYPKTYVSKKLP